MNPGEWREGTSPSRSLSLNPPTGLWDRRFGAGWPLGWCVCAGRRVLGRAGLGCGAGAVGGGWGAAALRGALWAAQMSWGRLRMCPRAVVKVCAHGQFEDAFMDHPLGKVLASLCGFGPRTGARTLAEISPTAAASPPTPGSPPSTGNQAAAPRSANPEAATTASKTPCSPPPSSQPSTTPTPAPTTSANAQKANATTPP